MFDNGVLAVYFTLYCAGWADNHFGLAIEFTLDRTLYPQVAVAAQGAFDNRSFYQGVQGIGGGGGG